MTTTTKFDLYTSSLSAQSVRYDWHPDRYEHHWNGSGWGADRFRNELAHDLDRGDDEPRWTSFESRDAGPWQITPTTNLDEKPIREVVEVCKEYGIDYRDHWNGSGWGADRFRNELAQVIFDAIDPYDEGPVMNYYYPLGSGAVGDPWEAAEKISRFPLCLVQFDDGEFALALTGGGMDLSWEICGAYIALGCYPPVYFAHNLPRMAGYEGQPKYQRIAEICVEACAIEADRAMNRVNDARRILAWVNEQED